MSDKKTIWIINQYAGSSIHGMEYRHYHLASEMISLGHKVVIISGSFSHLHKTRPEISGIATIETVDKIIYCWLKIPPYKKSISLGRFRNMIAFCRGLKKLKLHQLPEPDVIIVSSPSLFPVKIAHRWCKKFNAKFFFEIRDIWPLTLQEIGNLGRCHPLVLLMRHFEKYGYAHADYIVSLLPDALNHFETYGISSEKFVHIPNGVVGDDIYKIIDLPDEISNQIPVGKFLIGYTGTLGTANALNYLIDAARLLEENKKIHFLIVGNGDQKSELQRQAANLSNFTFINAVHKSLIPSILAKLDVCYIGLKKEPLFRFGVSPNKLFDYMMAGKPVVWAIDSSNKPVDVAECGISVEPENAEAIEKALIKLFQKDKMQLMEIGDNGRRYVLENHSYRHLAEKYCSLFEN